MSDGREFKLRALLLYRCTAITVTYCTSNSTDCCHTAVQTCKPAEPLRLQREIAAAADHSVVVGIAILVHNPQLSL
jgi:hypothetical protein